MQDMTPGTFSDMTSGHLECILHGAIGESKYKEGKYGEAMTQLRKAYTTAKEQGCKTHGGLSGTIMQSK